MSAKTTTTPTFEPTFESTFKPASDPASEVGELEDFFSDGLLLQADYSVGNLTLIRKNEWEAIKWSDKHFGPEWDYFNKAIATAYPDSRALSCGAKNSFLQSFLAPMEYAIGIAKPSRTAKRHMLTSIANSIGSGDGKSITSDLGQDVLAVIMIAHNDYVSGCRINAEQDDLIFLDQSGKVTKRGFRADSPQGKALLLEGAEVRGRGDNAYVPVRAWDNDDFSPKATVTSEAVTQSRSMVHDSLWQLRRAKISCFKGPSTADFQGQPYARPLLHLWDEGAVFINALMSRAGDNGVVNPHRCFAHQDKYCESDRTTITNGTNRTRALGYAIYLNATPALVHEWVGCEHSSHSEGALPRFVLQNNGFPEGLSEEDFGSLAPLTLLLGVAGALSIVAQIYPDGNWPWWNSEGSVPFATWTEESLCARTAAATELSLKVREVWTIAGLLPAATRTESKKIGNKLQTLTAAVSAARTLQGLAGEFLATKPKSIAVDLDLHCTNTDPVLFEQFWRAVIADLGVWYLKRIAAGPISWTVLPCDVEIACAWLRSHIVVLAENWTEYQKSDTAIGAKARRIQCENILASKQSPAAQLETHNGLAVIKKLTALGKPASVAGILRTKPAIKRLDGEKLVTDAVEPRATIKAILDALVKGGVASVSGDLYTITDPARANDFFSGQ